MLFRPDCTFQPSGEFLKLLCPDDLPDQLNQNLWRQDLDCSGNSSVQPRLTTGGLQQCCSNLNVLPGITWGPWVLPFLCS
jgi:hypothetical protein